MCSSAKKPFFTTGVIIWVAKNWTSEVVMRSIGLDFMAALLASAARTEKGSGVHEGMAESRITRQKRAEP